jgi:GH24 family phage-related lysozyme (muramidase)
MGAIFGALDGEPELSDEERGVEVAMLCDALENAFPRQAECFLQLAQFHPDDTLEDPHDVHREKIERLLREGKVGWVNDLKGDFVGAGNWAILVLADSGIPVLDAPGGKVFFEAKKTVPQVPFPMTDFIDHLERNDVEGFVSHMYKDTEGKVTIGIGTNLTDNGGAEGAIRMLLGKTLVKKTKELATPRQIEQDYDTVLALNLRTSGDKPAAAKAYARHTNIILSRAGARELAEVFVKSEIATVVRGGLYPDFETTLAKAQMGLMDIVYNVGYTRFANQFDNFQFAYNRRDWGTASLETFRSEISGARNGIVIGLFEDAARNQKFYLLNSLMKGTGNPIDNIE